MGSKLPHERAPGRFTFIPLLIFCVAILLGWWWATQRLAAVLGYQQQLGEPLFLFAGYPVYRPWQLFSWNYAYHYYAPEQFGYAIREAYGAVVAAIALVIAYAVWFARRARVPTTYGTARWGTDKDLKAAKLDAPGGVILGVDPQGAYLTHDGPEHVAVIAPPRSGKGAGPIICTLLSWPHSVVVNDIRGENYDATAGYRAQFGHVVYFNPTDPRSAHFNPLAEIRFGPRAVGDAQNIADMIVDPDGTGKPDHWDKTSHALLVAAILHVVYAEPNKTLPGLALFLADPARNIQATLQHMLDTQHADPDIHVAVASAARENLNRSPNELSGVMSTALSFLSLYRDPIVATNLADSDFRIDDLIYGPKPLSLYIVIPPSDINRTRALRRLLWAMIGRKLIEEFTPMHGGTAARPVTGTADARPRRRVLFLVDEFPALGRMDFFEQQLAYTGGYGIKCLLIAQSANQILKAYGPNNSILDLCAVRIFFAPNDEKTAETVSALAGQTTAVHQQRTFTGHRLAPWLSHTMVADQEAGRALITAGEVLTYPATDALLFVAGCPPFQIKKLFYFADPNFKQRVRPAPAMTGARPCPYGPPRRSTVWPAMPAARPPAAPAASPDAPAPHEPASALATPAARPAAPTVPAPEAPAVTPADLDEERDPSLLEAMRRVDLDQQQLDRRHHQHAETPEPDADLSGPSFERGI